MIDCGLPAANSSYFHDGVHLSRTSKVAVREVLVGAPSPSGDLPMTCFPSNLYFYSSKRPPHPEKQKSRSARSERPETSGVSSSSFCVRHHTISPTGKPRHASRKFKKKKAGCFL